MLRHRPRKKINMLAYERNKVGRNGNPKDRVIKKRRFVNLLRRDIMMKSHIIPRKLGKYCRKGDWQSHVSLSTALFSLRVDTSKRTRKVLYVSAFSCPSYTSDHVTFILDFFRNF